MKETEIKVMNPTWTRIFYPYTSPNNDTISDINVRIKNIKEHLNCIQGNYESYKLGDFGNKELTEQLIINLDRIYSELGYIK